jgi:sugar lactone lactonase YvrE
MARVVPLVALAFCALVACNSNKNLTPATQSCPTDQVQCGTLCVSLATDPSNCGACAAACETGLACVGGTCKPACPTGTLQCPPATGLCIDPQTDNANCSKCSNLCPGGTACSGGECKPSCGSGTLLCPNGTCVYPLSDNLNCGHCGNACVGGQACVQGNCTLTCVSGTIECANEPDSCVNPGTDNHNCGGCSTADGGGVTCPPGEVCSGGMCGESCSPGYTTCVPPVPDGGLDAGVDAGLPYCAQTNTDPNNCGACGKECGPGGACCPSANGSFCANILYDGNNCGECGHSCNGVACQQGLCVPTYLSLLQFGATDLKVDSTNVYYLANFSVWQLPKTGGSPEVISFGPFGASFTPEGIALSVPGTPSPNAYWSDFITGQVWRTPIPSDGGTVAKPFFGTVISPQQSPVPFGVAIDQYDVFYAGYSDAGVIESLALTGGLPFPATLASGAFQPNGLVVDSNNVYWTDALGGQVLFVNKLFGGTPQVIAKGQLTPTGIAVDPNYIYWASSGNGKIMKAPLDGGAPIALVTGLSYPTRIAVDSTTIYWTDYDAGMVLKAPLAGGAPQVIAYQQFGPDGIALDATNVYWTDNASIGAVVTAPK